MVRRGLLPPSGILIVGTRILIAARQTAEKCSRDASRGDPSSLYNSRDVDHRSEVGYMAMWSIRKLGGTMDKRNPFTKQAKMLKALAHESRLMIVDRLSRGECSVGDLRDLVGGDLSTVSKHLALLRAHGIVEDRREGTTVYYRLLTPCVCNFFTCATQVLTERSR